MNSRAGPGQLRAQGSRRSGEWAWLLQCLAAGLQPNRVTGPGYLTRFLPTRTRRLKSIPAETRFRFSESGGLAASIRAGPSVGDDPGCELALERAVDGLARAEVPKPPRLHRGGFTIFCISLSKISFFSNILTLPPSENGTDYIVVDCVNYHLNAVLFGHHYL